jgi:hypothetical protein
MFVNPGIISSSKYNITSLDDPYIPRHPLLDIAAPNVVREIARYCSQYLSSLETCGIIRNTEDLVQTDTIIYLPVHNDLEKDSQSFISPSKLRDINSGVTSITRNQEYDAFAPIKFSDKTAPKGVIRFRGMTAWEEAKNTNSNAKTYARMNPNATKVRDLLTEQGAFLFFNTRGGSVDHYFSFGPIHFSYNKVVVRNTEYKQDNFIFSNPGTYLLTLQKIRTSRPSYNANTGEVSYDQYHVLFYFLPDGGDSVINLSYLRDGSLTSENFPVGLPSNQYGSGGFFTDINNSVEYFELDNLKRTYDTLLKIKPGYSSTDLLDKIYKTFPNPEKYYDKYQYWNGLNYINNKYIKNISREDIYNFYNERSRSIFNRAIEENFLKKIKESELSNFTLDVNTDAGRAVKIKEDIAREHLYKLRFTENSVSKVRGVDFVGDYNWKYYFGTNSEAKSDHIYRASNSSTGRLLFRAGIDLGRYYANFAKTSEAQMQTKWWIWKENEYDIENLMKESYFYSTGSYSAFGGGTGLTSLQQIETFMKATDLVCRKIRT